MAEDREVSHEEVMRAVRQRVPAVDAAMVACAPAAAAVAKCDSPAACVAARENALQCTITAICPTEFYKLTECVERNPESTTACAAAARAVEKCRETFISQMDVIIQEEYSRRRGAVVVTEPSL